MFISDLAGMLVKPVIEGVASITTNTSEITSNSDVGKYILGGVAIIGGIIYVVQKDDTTSNYKN